MVDAVSPTRDALLPQWHDALAFAAEQARRILTSYPGYYPMYTVGGKWNREGERWTHWCEGFFPGILWLLHKHTGDPEWRRWAEEYSRPLEPRKHDRTVHDLGFIFFSTYLRWYRLTGDAALREVLIEAGRTLALRRQKGGYLASFVGPQSLFIDIMMNVGLIFWAANATGDDHLRQVALEHCRTTAKYLVRPDGGTAHEGIFDVATGQFLRQSTHQGWKPESTWSRGLAWALYGFTAAHRLSGEEEFLATARRCADFYLRRAPAGLVPYWDFDLPPPSPLPSPPAAGGEGKGFSSPLPSRGEEGKGFSSPLPSRGEEGKGFSSPLPPRGEEGKGFSSPLPPRGGEGKGEGGLHLWDSSAGAIAASGLWDLAEAVSDPAEQERYRGAALTILQTLCSDRFLARGRPEWEGILLHGVYHYHKGLGVDESVAWGEHFFVEALVKAAAGRSEAAW